MRLLLCCSLMVVSAYAQNPLTDSVMGRYKAVRQNLIATAEAMPEDSYSFKLTPAQRPFSGWMSHVTQMNYAMCSLMKGEKAPQHADVQSATDKPTLVKAVQDSFAYCDTAFEGMTDQKALAAVSTSGRETYPVQSMITLIVSANEHYGNLVGYLRSKGITPPSSQKK